jgi:hypothetical protein
MEEGVLVSVACALPLTDLFNFQQTSMCVRDAILKSGQWELAVLALEREFPFPREFPYRENENGDKSKWRQLNEPRLVYPSGAWDALSPLTRFAKLVRLGQVMTKDVERVALRIGSTYFNSFTPECFEGEEFESYCRLERDPARLQLTRTLTALSFFDKEMRSAKDWFEDLGWALPYDLEDELSEPGSFPGGSSGHNAIIEEFCGERRNGRDAEQLGMGSPQHLAELISPKLPFSQQERQLLGSTLVHSLHINLYAWMGQLADVWGVDEAAARTRVELLQGDGEDGGAGAGASAGAGAGGGAAGATTCSYGMSCFRKNPAHFTAEAHPATHPMILHRSPQAQPHYPVCGDSRNTRPKCQYANSCYRKNPRHKKDYRHLDDSDWSDDE